MNDKDKNFLAVETSRVKKAELSKIDDEEISIEEELETKYSADLDTLVYTFKGLKKNIDQLVQVRKTLYLK